MNLKMNYICLHCKKEFPISEIYDGKELQCPACRCSSFSKKEEFESIKLNLDYYI